jgi:hypothetical protein
MRRSIFDIALVKKTLRRFRFPLPYLPPLQGYNRWGRATQAKALGYVFLALRAVVYAPGAIDNADLSDGAFVR